MSNLRERPSSSPAPPSVPSSAQIDTFARDHLPPEDMWPVMNAYGIPDLDCPARLNAAVELLDRNVENGLGPRPCLRAGNEIWSYRKLLELANRIANLLKGRGLAPGGRVLLRDANSPMLAACWFAVLKAGGIAVTTMPQLRAQELAAIAIKAQIDFVLCAREFSEEIENAQLAGPVRERTILYDASASAELAPLLVDCSTEFINADTAQDDIALIAFSSGTTGEPKAAVHFHRDLLAVCDTYSAHILKPQADDIFCGSPPLAFTFGLGGLLLFPMRVGASTVLLPKATAEGLLQAIARHRCSICFTAPTLYRSMIEFAPRFDLSSLKKCVSAGERLPAAVFEAWRKATGLQIIDGIGSTELLHIFISAGGEEIRPGSTGKPVPGYQALVIDDAGLPVPANTSGRLAVRGPTGCRYLDAPDLQRKYVENGWNITGDAYHVDDDGYFWYEGRIDDLIVSSGYKISAVEIETALMGHPQVVECAVIGTPSEERGEIVKAFVVLRDGMAAGDPLRRELQNYVKSRIAPYKYPRAVEFVAELPRTSTGKLQRSRLREQELRKQHPAAPDS
ncbi:MAG TPA: benzoate-CoA ligase family protein [Candidatus Saccharimonadales bacterium]|jgi:2-aminobenzoate-CoA ligase|nr:benzoate-CoA ligase family protein [Candidatus Saccharimonadales bacterium]